MLAKIHSVNADLLGSTAERLLRDVPGSILAIRAPNQDHPESVHLNQNTNSLSLRPS